MAKLVVSILSSLDGYSAGPGGRLEGLPFGPAFYAHNLDLMRNADTYLFGATTFPMFEAYWPYVDRGPDSEPVAREIAERINAGRKLVVSDSLVVSGSSPWAKTEVVRRAFAHSRISELKAKPGKDLLIFGSHILAHDLLAKGLVDEFYLLIGNVVLGEGIRTFEPGPSAPFKLLGQRQLPGSDIAVLRYDCRPA
tara:strand:- start:5224 stop:5808 length:585 start_codon:yes stop_codon:yes gene_type:complete